jgi:hypothetical protein
MSSNCSGQGILVTYSGTGTAALYADCSGITAGVDEFGALIVRTGDGVERLIAGEVNWS